MGNRNKTDGEVAERKKKEKTCLYLFSLIPLIFLIPNSLYSSLQKIVGSLKVLFSLIGHWALGIGHWALGIGREK